MRTKEFFMRLGFLLPMAVWGVFIFLILFGIVANSFGVESAFFCTVYCKVGITLFVTAFLAIVYCQIKSCRNLE